NAVADLGAQPLEPRNARVGRLADRALPVELEDALRRRGPALGHPELVVRTGPLARGRCLAVAEQRAVADEIDVDVIAARGPVDAEIGQERAPRLDPVSAEVGDRERERMVDARQESRAAAHLVAQPLGDLAPGPVDALP